jgi:P-type conjugative transfer ATPase TrbB
MAATNLASINTAQDRDARLDQKLRRELGEGVLKLLADERTEDICLNPDSTLWVKRMNQPFEIVGQMPPSQAQSALGTIAAVKGTVIKHERPILETELPLDGSRFEGLEEYEASEILTSKDDPRNRLCQRARFLDSIRGHDMSHGEVIRAAIAEKKNILVVGATGSGKTTFVNAILDALARIAPHDRVISIEDTTELQCAVRNYVDLRAVGSVSMLDCLRACLRLKPTRIVVGEVRGGEAHTMLKAWNTGHPGGAATVHANDAVGGLVRLESLVAEATSAPQQALIAEAVDLVVFIDEEPNLPAGRKVREVAVVTGYEHGRYTVEYV